MARELPYTYSEMEKVFCHGDTQPSYLKMVKDKMEKFKFGMRKLKSKQNFEEMILREIMSSEHEQPEAQKNEIIRNILRILDEYNAAINEELFVLTEKKNIDGALQLCYEGQKIASIFLVPPHMMYLNGRGAITDCLWVKYGNKSYDASKNKP